MLQRKNTILYVDDDTDDLQYFDLAVKKINHGLTMKGYNNGKSFLHDIHANSPYEPLVFLDINMPEKNGFEVLRDLRKDKQLETLPVIMYSTSNDERAIAISRDLGASLYAIKPGKIGELTDLIEKMITKDWNGFVANESNFVFNPNFRATTQP